ncbi:MAG: hypothetical protein SFU57_07135 [Gemmatimonadales bacterium]|jgi:hypothetical protein|nr:hypothetical protein [Gemmatimonadales bacterium]MDZ4259558.1 hypothetical protein [Gemmatimonadales bacterium]MDZ4389890.1 hypothetical protein [Gemmatimonadales bacterium]
MKYFHRTAVSPDAVIALASTQFGSRLAPTGEGRRRLAFAGALGSVTVTVEAEGGHYTRVTVATDQPGESELDKLAKRFLGEVHVLAEPQHALRGAY